MRRSDFSSGIEPASLPSWALPSPDRRRSLRGRVNDFSPPPPPIPACHGLDTGRRVERHACPGRPALRGFTCVRDCESPRASIPHALTGKAAAVQCPPRPRAVASGFWLPPIGPIKDSHLLSFIHVQRTAGEALQALGGSRGRRERARVPSTAGSPSRLCISPARPSRPSAAHAVGGNAQGFPRPRARHHGSLASMTPTPPLVPPPPAPPGPAGGGRQPPLRGGPASPEVRAAGRLAAPWLRPRRPKRKSAGCRCFT